MILWDKDLTFKGMKISKEKTEIMILRKEREVLNIRLRDQDLEQPE